MAAEGGKEGDWQCGGCRNRNYAFRSFCNRCKQPRLLVDTKTPRDSKWLPRVGDWICTGCSNNNYASRENCKKCGLSKEEAAMPALAMPGVSLHPYAQYVARTQGLVQGLKMNFGIAGNSALQQSLLPSSNWQYGMAERYGLQSSPSWPFDGSHGGGVPYASNANQFPVVPKDWRHGDWICTCGFHNYSSRTQCKECNAPMPSSVLSTTAKAIIADTFSSNSALGTKRLASDEFVNDWDKKRLNAGQINNEISQQLFASIEQAAGCINGQEPGILSKYANGNLTTLPSGQATIQSPQAAATPALIGKGAKQWRDGDWMCNNCSNHNFASRTNCNRCKSEKAADAPSGVL